MVAACNGCTCVPRVLPGSVRTSMEFTGGTGPSSKLGSLLFKSSLLKQYALQSLANCAVNFTTQLLLFLTQVWPAALRRRNRYV